jgi:hypothetical protein
VRFGPIGAGRLRPLDGAAVPQDPNGLVPGERSFQILIEGLALARDEDELPDLRLRQARERCPRGATAGRASLGDDVEALVARETESELSQR